MGGSWGNIASGYNNYTPIQNGFNPLPPSYTNSGVASTSGNPLPGGGGGMGWVLPAATVAGNALSSLLSGASAARQARMDREQREAEFRRTLQFQQQQLAQQGQIANRGMTGTEAGEAVGIRRGLDSAPLRDQVLYSLMQRMSQVPQNFVGRDMHNPTNGTPQQGGIDAEALQRALALYRPGMGGVETSVPEAALANLGYHGNYGNNATNPGAALNQRNYGYISPNGPGSPQSGQGGYGPTGTPTAKRPPKGQTKPGFNPAVASSPFSPAVPTGANPNMYPPDYGQNRGGY